MRLKSQPLFKGESGKKDGMDEYKAFTAWKGVSIEKVTDDSSDVQELTPFPILDTSEKETKDDLPF